MGRKITFLGVEFNVLDEEDILAAQLSDEPKIYSMIRVADADPNGGSPQLRARRVTTRCSRCKEVCWLDPESYKDVAVLKPTMLCLECTAARAEEESDG